MRNNRFASDRGRISSPSGSPIHELFSSQMQDNGVINLIKVGEENTDEVIQSYFESTDLHQILARYFNGDEDAISALNKFQPVYMDLTQAPKDLRETIQIIHSAQHAFDALPVEIKKQFGNDVNQWLASAGDKDWLKVMDPLITRPAAEPAPAAEPDPAAEPASPA